MTTDTTADDALSMRAIAICLLFALTACPEPAKSKKEGEQPKAKPEQPIYDHVALEAAVRGKVGTLEAVVAAAGQPHKLGEFGFEYDDAKAIRVRATLKNESPPMSRAENRVLAHALVKVTIDALMATAIDPSEQGLYISGYVYQPMKRTSPTGKPLLRTHVSAAYNSVEDKIEVSNHSP